MTDNIEIYALDKKIKGETYGHWTGEWWKHMISSNFSGSGGVFKFQADGMLTDLFYAHVIISLFFLLRISMKNCKTFLMFLSIPQRKRWSAIEKQGENIMQFDPVRVYTSIRGIKYTKNLSRKVEGDENLFYSIDIGDGDFKEGQDIQAFADGHWVFFKIKEPGVYKLQTALNITHFEDVI